MPFSHSRCSRKPFDAQVIPPDEYAVNVNNSVVRQLHRDHRRALNKRLCLCAQYTNVVAKLTLELATNLSAVSVGGAVLGSERC